MASTHNAFELLFGSEQSSKPGSKKKRNKKKQHIVALQGAPLLTEVPQAVPAEVDDDHGFQPVPHHQIIKLRANSKAYNNSEGEKQHALPSASSVCASIEKDASNLSASSRAVVVDKWTRQVLQAEKGQKYSSGTQQLNFKQVLLKSSAIDQLVEGCLNDSRSAEVSVYLARLFDAIAHAASPEGLASALVSVIISHSQLAAADPLFDCTQSRQVISGALNVIKAGLPNAQSGQKAAVKNLDDLSVKLEQLEAKLPNVSGLKEQACLWHEIHVITQQQVDVAFEAEMPPLTLGLELLKRQLLFLHGTLQNRLKDVENANSGASFESQLKHADAILSDSQTAIQAQLVQVDRRMKELEKELDTLKKEAVQLKERHALASERHEQLLVNIKNGEAAPASLLKGLQAGLGAVNQLKATLEGASSAQPNNLSNELTAQLMVKDVPKNFLKATRQVLELQIKTLQELATKAQFYRERLAQAVWQGEHLSLLKLADEKQKQEQKKHIENLKKMLQEVCSTSHVALTSCEDAAQACKLRMDMLQSFPGFALPSSDFETNINDMVLQASQLMQQITADPKQHVAFKREKEMLHIAAENKHAEMQAGDVPNDCNLRGHTTALSAENDVAALEERLAQLEEQNKQKDAQIAALLSQSSMEVPSPIPAMLRLPPAFPEVPAQYTVPQAPRILGSHNQSQPDSLFLHSRSLTQTGTEQASAGQADGSGVAVLPKCVAPQVPGRNSSLNSANAPKGVSSFAEVLSGGPTRAALT